MSRSTRSWARSAACSRRKSSSFSLRSTLYPYTRSSARRASATRPRRWAVAISGSSSAARGSEMAIKQSQPVVGRAADLAQYSTQEFGRKVLAETDRFRVVIAALEDGQEIPLHAPPLDMVLTLEEGMR